MSKQKPLYADPRAIKQIVFQGVAGEADNTKIRLHTILKKSKETVVELCKGTTKVLWEYIMVEYDRVNVNLSDSQLNQIKSAAKN